MYGRKLRKVRLESKKGGTRGITIHDMALSLTLLVNLYSLRCL